MLLGWAGWLAGAGAGSFLPAPLLERYLAVPIRTRPSSGRAREHKPGPLGGGHQIRPGGMGRPGLVGLGWKKKSRVGQGLKGEGVRRGRGWKGRELTRTLWTKCGVCPRVGGCVAFCVSSCFP